jgi:hypothetical protein
MLLAFVIAPFGLLALFTFDAIARRGMPHLTVA